MKHVKQTTAPDREARVAAVSLDALGTMVLLEPPWEHLAAALEMPIDGHLIGAVEAEMAYYREHSHEGRDPASLAALRERCAEVLSAELGRRVPVDTMMGAIRFRAYPDAAPALRALRRRGVRPVCVSNWDCSLPDVLARCGLGELLDGVMSSAQAGVRKPDPAIFLRGLELVGAAPPAALHVGDTPSEDVAGARAAGMGALLIDRSGGGDIVCLSELDDRLDTMSA